jgi:hypothetical protein
MSVTCFHNAGFFSCCSEKLFYILDYINNNFKLPEIVDSSYQFEWYKIDKTKDITFEYFEHYDNININFDIKNKLLYYWNDQFWNYSNLDYTNLNPIIKKYFSPSKSILHLIDGLEKKYNLDYNNICVLFYRGNDKITETNLGNYEDFIININLILKNNPSIQFLIQSDETEFIEYMKNYLPNNSFYFKDEIRHMNKCNGSVDLILNYNINEFSKYFLAITIIMSKCEFIICNSGNISKWIMYYRGHNKNVYQFLNDRFLIN